MRNQNEETARVERGLREDALEYHRRSPKGKIEVVATKPLFNQRDLSLAYSPGVAFACEEIAAAPSMAADYTSRGNLVAVVTNGTAVLGLGNIGPLASKPVMEGKAILFKKFAGVNVFDLELAENDPDKLIDAIAMLEPTVGGINLEDIKAPECFYIEKKLSERMNIPVFHDDQHGTAIISGAALLNALVVVGKDIGQVKVAASGAGAAAIACLDMLVGLGVKREHIWVADSRGVIWQGREPEMETNKARYAQNTSARTLADIVAGADVFLGCSTSGVLTATMVKTMAYRPVILALANPEPEIRPEVAKAVRPDAIIATGRSDYPNQVNNVLCFPYIFRGALDCGATRITEEMKLACVKAIAHLAHAETHEAVAAAYINQDLTFGPDYIIPKPFDPRLLATVAPAVAAAAAESGVATRPIRDMGAYRERLHDSVFQTASLMRPVFARARSELRRVAYAEGSDVRVLRAVQTVVDEGLAHPILIGSGVAIEEEIGRLGLRLRRNVDFTLVEAVDNTTATLQGSLLVKLGGADALICGTKGSFDSHFSYIRREIPCADGNDVLATMNALILDEHILFITDTYVNDVPTPTQLAAITILAAEQVKLFGLKPKVALLSHSSFGSSHHSSAQRLREARDLLNISAPTLSSTIGGVQGDVSLAKNIRRLSELVTGPSSFSKSATLLVMPSLDAANILFNVLKISFCKGITVGPILIGTAAPAHILNPSATVCEIVNMTALAAANVK